MLCLVTYNDDVDFDAITESLDVLPSNMRRITDFPMQSINLGVAENEWVVSIENNECLAIWKPVKQLQIMFQNKESLIKEICKKYDMKAILVIVINMEEGNGPEIVLSQENIKFLSDIGAEVDFDIYIV